MTGGGIELKWETAHCARRWHALMAEGEGFEPPVPCGTPVFKTGSFNHSDTPPSV